MRQDTKRFEQVTLSNLCKYENILRYISVRRMFQKIRYHFAILQLCQFPFKWL